MEVKQFLKRINLENEVIKTDLQSLTKIMKAIRITIPYENLDSCLGKDIKLSFEIIYDKIVTNGRGGWCHEKNALTCWALRELGFKVDMLNSNSRNYTFGGYNRDFDHMILVAFVDGKPYMVDCGWAFVVCPVIPVLIEDGNVVDDVTGSFKITLSHDDLCTVWIPNIAQAKLSKEFELEFSPQDPWRPMQKFRLTPHELEDFQNTCTDYSRFVDDRVVFLRHPYITILHDNPETGQIEGLTLTARHFRRVQFGVTSKTFHESGPETPITILVMEEEITSCEEFAQRLSEHFKIDIDVSSLKEFNEDG